MANSKSKPSTDIAAYVRERLKQHVKPGQRACVALSGGMDSVSLMHATIAVSKQLQLDSVTAIHVHHGLSPNADAWEAFCRRVCEDCGIPIVICRVSVNPKGEGVEAAARSARYGAFDQSDSDWILLGHHRNDQAESLLLNILRGSGVHGAAGIKERRGRFLRPLLGVSRAHIEEYARWNALGWIDDESNASHDFTRNFLRNKVIPLIEQKIPQASASLTRAASMFAEAADLLDQMAADDLGNERRLSIARLRSLPNSRAANLLAFYLRREGVQIPSSATLSELLRQLVGAGLDNDILFLMGDYEIRCFQSYVCVDRRGEAVTDVEWNGESALRWGSYQLCSRRVIGDGIDTSLLGSQTLRFSVRQGGEVIQQREAGPHRAIKDLLREAGIPPWRRKCMPILFAGNEVVWLPYFGVAAQYRCKPDAAGILIEFDGLTW